MSEKLNGAAVGSTELLECPFCKTKYEIYCDVYEHPNSMYSIRSCEHINISRCSTGQDALNELKRVLADYSNASAQPPKVG